MQRFVSRRFALLASVFVLALSVSFGTTITKPPPAEAQLSCNMIPEPLTRSICQGLGAVGGAPGVPTPGEVAGDVVSGIAEGGFKRAMRELLEMEAEAVAGVLQKQADFINDTSTPSLGADWFRKQYAVVLGMAFLVGVFLFYVRLAEGVKNQDPAIVGNSFFSLMVLLIGGVSIPALVAVIVAITDGPLTQDFLAMARESAETSLKSIQEQLLNTGNIGGAILLPIIILAFGVIGGVFVALELYFREAAIYLFTAAEAVALALAVGGRMGKPMFMKITQGLIGVILLKPIMAFVLGVSFGLLGSGEGNDPVIMGTVGVLLTPVISWKAYQAIAHQNIHPGSSLSKLGSQLRKLASR